MPTSRGTKMGVGRGGGRTNAVVGVVDRGQNQSRETGEGARGSTNLEWRWRWRWSFPWQDCLASQPWMAEGVGIQVPAQDGAAAVRSIFDKPKMT